MPRYVVHIGPHKTGSTYLQASFLAAESQLLERGTLYARKWLGEGGVSQELLCRRLRSMQDDELAREFDELNRSSHEIILISSEDISDLKKEQIAYFKNLTAGSPTQIIFYCRRWSEVIPSGWQEMVKHGYIQAFPVSFAAHIAHPYASHVMNFANTLTKFAEIFGMGAIRLVSYNHLVDRNIDLFAHFARTFLGLPNPPPSVAGRPNASIGVFEAETIRVLNALEWARTGARSGSLYRKFVQNRAAATLPALVTAMEQDLLTLQLNEDGSNLRALHRSIFEKFGSQLVEPRSGEFLFTPRNSKIPFVGQNYLLVDGVLDALKRLHDQLR